MLYEKKYGKTPCIREIGKAVGISSTSTVSGYLNRMVRDGVLIIDKTLKYRKYIVLWNN